MLELKSVQLVPEINEIRSVYTLKHSTPGRDGTTFSADITVVTGPSDAKVLCEQIGSTGNDVEAAMDKLASLLERAAIAIRHRGSPTPAVVHYQASIRPVFPPGDR